MQVFQQESFQIFQNRNDSMGEVTHKDSLVESIAIIEREIEGSIINLKI